MPNRILKESICTSDSIDGLGCPPVPALLTREPMIAALSPLDLIS